MLLLVGLEYLEGACENLSTLKLWGIDSVTVTEIPNMIFPWPSSSDKYQETWKSALSLYQGQLVGQICSSDKWVCLDLNGTDWGWVGDICRTSESLFVSYFPFINDLIVLRKQCLNQICSLCDIGISLKTSEYLGSESKRFLAKWPLWGKEWC